MIHDSLQKARGVRLSLQKNTWQFDGRSAIVATRSGWEQLLIFCVQGFPNGVGGFTNTVPLDQFPRHRREHVIVFIDALQSFAGELALHGESHEEFLPHQA